MAAYRAGDGKKALGLQLKYLELINALFIEVNPIPIKEAMNMLGMEAGPCRLPLCGMEDKKPRSAPKGAARAGGSMKVILVGYGRMGKMIEGLLAPRTDVELLGAVSPGLYETPQDVPGKPDALFDFSYPGNLEATLLPRGGSRRCRHPRHDRPERGAGRTHPHGGKARAGGL